MTSSAQKVKVEHPRKASFLYYMCLLDWGGAVLDEATHQNVAHSIMPNIEPTEGWYITQGEDSGLQRHGVKPEFLCGFYHSRVILRFELAARPKTISQVREIRQAIEGFTETYLKETIFPKIRIISGIYPKAFIYPVFELNDDCPFWKFGKASPYTFQTTCFYTDLRDPEFPRWSFLQIRGIRIPAKAFFPATVKIRISGAKIITSPMSEWFFWNLTNLVYHEGLYRQQREQQISSDVVYKGLEVRLEDFADRLMASFSQSITNVVQRTLTWWLVLLTILLIAVTVALIIVSLARC